MSDCSTEAFKIRARCEMCEHFYYLSGWAGEFGACWIDKLDMQALITMPDYSCRDFKLDDYYRSGNA